MTTLNFGPEWLRNLTGSGSLAAGAMGSVTASSSSSSTGTDSGGSCGANSTYSGVRYKLAEHRYGREEMLALYAPQRDVPAELKELSVIMSVKLQPPLALEPMSKEEQSLLLQCVNSAPMMRSMGRGNNSIHGGRGEGRGRGRGGRDEDGLGKMRTRDWDDRGGRGFERGYSAYGSEDVSGLPLRELPRSISIESWRENRQHHEDDELDFRKPDRDRRYEAKDRYGPKNWREPRSDHMDQHEFDDTRRGRPQTTESTHALPEWSTTNPQDVESIGMFDSSGAFLPVKEKSVEKSDGETASSVVKNSDARPCRSLACDLPTGGDSGGNSLSALEMIKKPPSILREQLSPNGVQLNGMAIGSSSSSLSSVAPTSHGLGIFAQHLPIDSVNSRTVDGAGCERNDADLRGPIATATASIGSLGNRPGRTSDVLGLSGAAGGLQLAEQELVNASADVADFVSKWAGESDGKFVDNGQPGNLPKVEFNKDRWFYKDPQGDVQGPFTNAEMNEWLRTGYFTMNLLVRHESDGDFCRLGDMIKALGYVPFEPRIGIASQAYSNPLASASPVVTGLNQQQQQQQQQLQQKLEQLRKIQQHQLLVAMQQQQQGLLPQEYLRQMQVVHQQQIQQLLHLQQQTQHRLPPLPVQDGFGVMLPSFDPLLGPIPSHPAFPALHPAVIASSNMHILQSSQLAASNSTLSSSASSVPAAVNVTAPSETNVSSKCEADMPPTVDQMEKLQLFVMEHEKKIEMQRLEEWKKLEQQRKAEEDRRMMEEMRKVEMGRQKLEEERRNLEELHRQMERERAMMEEQQLENERMRLLQQQKEEEERQARERTRLEEEKREQQRLEAAERLKKEADAKRRLAELEAKQKAEAEARLKAEAEAKLKAEAEAKLKAEAEAKLKAEAAEARRQMEAVARQKAEAEARLKEEAQRKKALPPAKSAWSNSAGKNTTDDGGCNAATISEIQEAEKLELYEEQQRFLERQQATATSFEQTKQSNSTWTTSRPQPEARSVPSLLQIQQEQEKQLQEGGRQEKAHLLSTKVAEAPFGGPATWKSGSQPVQWNKGGNSSGNTWTTAEPVGKKKSSASADNSQFPALGSAASAQSGKKTSSAMKSEKVASKSKKEEDVVQKLFQVTKVRDELTEWCEKVLNGLQTSVDIPTLVDLLKDIESPQEVMEYVRMYLGDSKQVRDFAQQFLERRSKAKSSAKQKPSEDNMWGGKPSVTHSQLASTLGGKTHPQQAKTTTTPASGPAGQKSVGKEAGEAPKGKKKKKMQKVDSNLLGFNVCANSERVNIGEIDSV